MSTSPIKQLSTRFRTEWLSHQSLSKFYDEFDALDRAVASLEAHRAKLVAEGNLTPAGIDDAMRSFAKQKVVPVIKNAHDRIDSAANAVKAKRAKLAIPPIDKGDASAAALRAEIRAHIRNMRPAERKGFVLQNATAEVLGAILEAPQFLSGVDDDIRKQAEALWVERTSPKEVQFADDAMEALKTVDVALKVALNGVQTQTGFSGKQREFDKWMAQASPPVEKVVLPAGDEVDSKELLRKIDRRDAAAAAA